MRRLVGCFFMCMMAVMLLIGCATGDKIEKKTLVKKENKAKKKEEKPVIGVTLAAKSSYLLSIVEPMKDAAMQENVELNIQFADWNVEQQQKQMNEYIEQGVGAIILAPVNAKEMLTSLKRAKEAKIPVINLNMKVDGISSEYIETYVGASSSEEGEQVAEMFVDILGEEGGKIGIVEGAPGSDPQIYRTQGFAEALAEHKDIHVVGMGNGGWKRSQAKLVTIDLVRNNQDIKGIYCHDSEMAMGTIEALEEMNLLSQVKVVGIGENEEYIQAIKEKKLTGIVTQPPEYEGKQSVYCAAEKIKGKKLRPWYKDPIQVLTWDNVDAYASQW